VSEFRKMVEEQRLLPIPRCTPWEVTIRGDDGEPVKDLGRYLESFQPPRVTRNRQLACAGCGEALTGFLFGTFEWGLAHGEGRCCRCGWPVRMYHYLKGQNGIEVHVEIPLCYHPDELLLIEERL